MMILLTRELESIILTLRDFNHCLLYSDPKSHVRRIYRINFNSCGSSEQVDSSCGIIPFDIIWYSQYSDYKELLFIV